MYGLTPSETFGIALMIVVAIATLVKMWQIGVAADKMLGRR